MKSQKEQSLYLIGRRIFGDPGRMEEIFGVLRQRKPDGTLGILGEGRWVGGFWGSRGRDL